MRERPEFPFSVREEKDKGRGIKENVGWQFEDLTGKRLNLKQLDQGVQPEGPLARITQMRAIRGHSDQAMTV